MKRSRRSEYDKKRDRSKKDSKRKFTFSNKSENKKSDVAATSNSPKKSSPSSGSSANYESSSTSGSSSGSSSNSTSNSTSNTFDRLQRFEIDENQEKKYQQTYVPPKEKSGCANSFKIPAYIVVAIIVVRLILRFISYQSSNNTSSSKIEDYLRDKRYTTEKTRTKRNKKLSSVNAAKLIVGKNKPLREVVQLEKDSIKDIIPHVQVRLFRRYHMYDSSLFPTTPMLAKFSKYYFFYDEVKVTPNMSLTEQWISHRKQFLNEANDDYFYHERTTNRNVEDLVVKEEKFSILTEGIAIYGAATLVEYKGKRYFFHFISKNRIDETPNYAYTRKYLDYYLKIR